MLGFGFVYNRHRTWLDHAIVNCVEKARFD
jgi:hypothetical protein